MRQCSSISARYTPRRFGAALALVVCLVGCDGLDDVAAGLESSLKQRTEAKSKAGTLRGLEVVSRASEVAASWARRADPDCRLSIGTDGPITYRATIELETRSAHGVERSWRESRTFRRDADGNLAVISSGTWGDQIGLEARHKMHWRLIDGHSFVSNDGRAFYRRPADAAEARRVKLAGMASLQTLLDASEAGWSEGKRKDRQQRVVWSAGGGPLRCGPASPAAAGWLRRLAGDAEVLGAELTASTSRVDATNSPARRTLSMTWRLEQGSTLTASFEDRLRPGAASVERPEEVVDMRRDRSLRHIDRLVDRMLEAGMIDDIEASDVISEETTR